MADADLGVEADAGDDAVINAILTAKDGPPREPPAEGDEPPPDDEEAPDEEETEDPDAEPSEKEEAEEEVKASDEDVDVDELLVEIVIDGKPVEVPLKDLKQNYSGNKYIEQQVQKAVEIRRAVEHNAAALYQANTEARQKLERLNEVLDSLAQPQIDWDALKARNPTEYMLKREEQREIQDKQRLVAQEVERIDAEQAALQSQARQRIVIDQAQRLAERLPELTDAKKAPQVMARMIKAAEYFGIPKSEVEGIVDHRHMLVLHFVAEALFNDQKTKVRQKANGDASVSTPPPKKVILRPGSSQNSAANQAKRLTAEAYRRARQTGSVEDVAKTLILSSPRGR